MGAPWGGEATNTIMRWKLIAVPSDHVALGVLPFPVVMVPQAGGTLPSPWL